MVERQACIMPRRLIGADIGPGHQTQNQFGKLTAPHGGRYRLVRKLALNLSCRIEVLQTFTRQVGHRRRQGFKAEDVPVTRRAEDFTVRSQRRFESRGAVGVEILIEQLQHRSGFPDCDAGLV